MELWRGEWTSDWIIVMLTARVAICSHFLDTAGQLGSAAYNYHDAYN